MRHIPRCYPPKYKKSPLCFYFLLYVASLDNLHKFRQFKIRRRKVIFINNHNTNFTNKFWPQLFSFRSPTDACSKFHKNINKLTNMHNLHKLKMSMVLIILITVFCYIYIVFEYLIFLKYTSFCDAHFSSRGC